MKDEINNQENKNQNTFKNFVISKKQRETGSPDNIKEKLLKGCGKEILYKVNCGDNLGISNLWFCPTCKAKLQQHEETSKYYEDKIFKLEGDISVLQSEFFEKQQKLKAKDKM